jgi:sigma-B regulation protein RsbU (phosphoserine phosphatase)
MSFTSSRYLLLAVFLLDLLLALTALVHRRDRRSSLDTLCISGYLLLSALWALGTHLESLPAAPAAGMIYTNLTLLPFGFLPFLFLLLAVSPDASKHGPPAPWLLVLVEPVLLNVLAWIVSLRQLIWQPALLQPGNPEAALACCPGPLITVHTAVACLTVLAGSLYGLLRTRKHKRRFGAVRQVSLLAAGLLPWLIDGAVRLGINPAGFYPTPLAAGASALLLGALLFPRLRSDLMPFAFETVVNSMGDPVIVLDLQNRIIRHNKAADKLITRTGAGALEQEAATPLEKLNARVTENGELIISRGGERRSYDLGLSPLLDKQNRRRGNIMVLRDISDRKAMERELRTLNARIKSDLERAVSLQASLLPHSFRQVPGVHFDWLFEPCDELAGDLFNIFRLDEQHVGFYLLDVSGHGLVAALLSFALGRLLSPLPDQSSLLKRCNSGDGGNTLTNPVEVAEILNRQFPFNAETQQYFSLFYGIYNFHSRLLRYVSAGNGGFAYLPVRETAVIRALPSFPIGFVRDPGYREQQLQLDPGDRLYLFSDGVIEAPDAQGRQYGNQSLLNILSRSSALSLRRSLDALLDNVRHWGKGTQRCDDMSVLAMEVEPARKDGRQSPEPASGH